MGLGVFQTVSKRGAEVLAATVTSCGNGVYFEFDGGKRSLKEKWA